MNKIKKFILILPLKVKKNFLLLFLLMIFLGFLEIISIGAVVPVIGIMLDPDFVNRYQFLNSLFNYFGIINTSNYIYFALIVLASIYIFKSIFVIILNYKKNKLVYDTRVELSSKLLELYIRQDYEEYTRRGSYILINNILKEIPYLVDGILTPAITIMIEIVTFIFIFLLLVWYEPIGTLSIFIFFGLYALIYHFLFSNRTKNQGKVRAESEQKSSAQIIQSINGLKEIKLWLKENFFIKRFDEDLKKVSKAQTIGTTYQELPKAITEVVGIIAFCILVTTFLKNTVEFSSIIIKLGFFAAAGLRIMPCINRVMGSIHLIKFYYPNIDIIINEFAKHDEKKLIEANKKIIEISDFNSIKFRDVSFKYAVNKDKILENINLNLNKGEFIGISGKSGSGKSTFVDLLTSLLKPTEGEILIDNLNLKNVTNEWKKIIGYVPQNIFISDTTLKNNIAFSTEKEEIDEKHLQDCIKKAQIDEFLDQLPERENTQVGEKGLKLSGGQIQRIAIARCLYKKSKILIFDESTNALDLNTESKILDTIIYLKKHKTIFMITHKANSLRFCDRILKIENNNVIESKN